MFKFVCFNFWKHTKIIQVRLYNACYFQSNSVEDLQWGGWVGVERTKDWPRVGPFLYKKIHYHSIILYVF